MSKTPRPPSARARKTDAAVSRIAGRVIVPPPADPRQAGLFDAPLPDWIHPCLPTLVDKPPVGPQWAHEIKMDGYRVSTYVDDGKVTIYTRNGHDWTHRFPTIAAAVADLPLHSAVIDGEAIALDDNGKPSFSVLQASLGTSGRGPGRRQAAEASLYAFDLLFLDGHDLRPWSLANRRDALQTVLGAASPALAFSESFDVTGADLFALACGNELEGIVSKRLDLPYTSGRRDDWLKTKCVRDGTFVVIGYQPSATYRSSLGAVHVATEEDGDLRYVGAVGSGFSRDAGAAMQKRLDAMAIESPAVTGLRIKGAKWARPKIRVDVNYRAVTREGVLRHASFKGVRED